MLPQRIQETDSPCLTEWFACIISDKICHSVLVLWVVCVSISGPYALFFWPFLSLFLFFSVLHAYCNISQERRGREEYILLLLTSCFRWLQSNMWNDPSLLRLSGFEVVQARNDDDNSRLFYLINFYKKIISVLIKITLKKYFCIWINLSLKIIFKKWIPKLIMCYKICKVMLS